MACFLCPNMCGVNRSITEGICHADNDMRICRIAKHFYEEPIISGKNGSGTVFFSGCSLDCDFCQNYEISKRKIGKKFTPAELAEAIAELEKEGVHNINFVTPTHFSERIRETLDIRRPNIPVVYNTSGFERAEIIREMHEYTDVYLTDFKYSNNEIAYKYSHRKGYFDCFLSATEEMVNGKKLVYGEDGTLNEGVIIRHLVLPGELENSLKALEIFAERWKDRAVLSVMSQFFPTYKSPIKRTLKPIEYKIIINKVLALNIENCFIQELSSACAYYVPIFDLN